MRAALFLSLLCGSALAATPSSKLQPAPVFPAGSVSDVIQGVTVADPYRALENGADPAVGAWSDAENARTRAYLDALPHRAEIAQRLTTLVKATSPAFTGLVGRPNGIFGIYTDPKFQQPMLVTLDLSADPATRRSVFDPNAIDPTGGLEIDWFVPSPDGSRVAVSLSKGGSEDGTLHILDTATGKDVETPIDRVQFPTGGGSVAWTADGKGFWYTRYPGAEAPENERRANQKVFFHTLGADAAKDVLVLSDADGLPRTAEVFLDNGRAGKRALASVQLGDGGQWQQYVLEPGQKARQVGRYEDRVIGGGVIDADGTIYGVSRLHSPKGEVVRLAPPYEGGFAKAQTIVAAEKEAAIIDGGETDQPLLVTANRLFVNRVAGGPSEVTVYDHAGGHAQRIDLAGIAAANDMTDLPNGDVLYRVAAYTEPPHYLRWHPETGKSEPTALVQTSPISYSDAEVSRISAVSKDGTKVPLTIIAKKGLKLDGSHPALLWGYGGYGINQSPRFLGALQRLWLDAGGVYAIANIRGGGEFGEDWHRQGMLTQKQNVFDDFTAAAETLIERKYTDHAKLALIGGSNGGLLMGAVMTQHPALARAVVSMVGVYDMLRSELEPNGAYNVTEYGSVKDPTQFKVLYAYSPLHHVAKGTAYPAVLLSTGANDGRVDPLHSRKFAAALQAATSSDRPILLRTSKGAGHGIGSSLDERIGLSADQLVFLFDQLDIDSSAAVR